MSIIKQLSLSKSLSFSGGLDSIFIAVGDLRPLRKTKKLTEMSATRHPGEILGACAQTK